MPTTYVVQYRGADTRVVGVAGDVDVLAAAELGETLHGLLDDEPGELIVDLERVTFLGTSGLLVLRQVRDRCRLLGVPMVLVGSVRESVARSLTILGLDRLRRAGSGVGPDRAGSASRNRGPAGSNGRDEVAPRGPRRAGGAAATVLGARSCRADQMWR